MIKPNVWKRVNGEWLVYGEHVALKHKVGCLVKVTSAKGEVKEVRIVRLGTPILVLGHYMVNAHIEPTSTPRRAGSTGRRVVNGLCQICFSAQWWNCGCDNPADA